MYAKKLSEVQIKLHDHDTGLRFSLKKKRKKRNHLRYLKKKQNAKYIMCALPVTGI